MTSTALATIGKLTSVHFHANPQPSFNGNLRRPRSGTHHLPGNGEGPGLTAAVGFAAFHLLLFKIYKQ